MLWVLPLVHFGVLTLTDEQSGSFGLCFSDSAHVTLIPQFSENSKLEIRVILIRSWSSEASEERQRGCDARA